MHRIRDWLYITDYPTAISADIMQKHGIQAMLLLYKDIALEEIDRTFIPVLENVKLKPQQIQQAIDFIHAQHSKKHRILSTCGAGISRSSMFAIIALVEIEKLSMADAYYEIYRVHPKAMPDHLHWESVSKHYGQDSDFWKIWGDVTLRNIDESSE